MIWMQEPFRSAWANKNPFDEVELLSAQALPQNIYRNKEGRRTLRFKFAEKSYFLKYHAGIGWSEILKNILQLRLPVLGASNEYIAANKLHKLGVDTLTPLAYGSRGINPATQESFLITEDLVNTISIEDYCNTRNIKNLAFAVKKALINKVAQATRVMHENGINHRDFYICHFLLENNAEQKILANEDFCCYLIDLHRCQLRKKVPKRWLEKDLGGLLYSAIDKGLSARDYFRFIKIYTGKSLRVSLNDSLWCDVLVNAEKLYKKDFAKTPPDIFSRVEKNK
jgi:heptose I phosphotransferase